MKKNLGLIFAGLVFFTLPNFNLFDVMPDFIGALFIMAGLSKMYMYDGNFEDAKRSAKFLLWISVLRLVLCFWTNSAGRQDYLLPFTFIVCVLEAIYMISLFKGLYLGLEYTLMRADSERLTKKTNEAFTMSFIFVIASRLLEFAPQICEVLAQDAELDLSSGASFKMSMAQMKMYVTVVCISCGLILGIIYLFVTADAWIRIIADKNYAPFLKEKYNEYLGGYRDEFISSKISVIYFALTLSFVFFFDFFIDGINIIPSPVGVLLLCVSGICCAKLLSYDKIRVACLSLFALVSSCVSYIFMNKVRLGVNYLLWLETYNHKEFPLLEKSGAVFSAIVIGFIEFVLCTCLVVLVLSLMRRIFAKEKRTVALPMLKVLTIPSVLMLLCSFACRVSQTLEAHLTSKPAVLEYVRNKAYITKEAEYLEYMKNPLVSGYEKVSSVSYILSIAVAVLAVICILYSLRIRRFTEGENDGRK